MSKQVPQPVYGLNGGVKNFDPKGQAIHAKVAGTGRHRGKIKRFKMEHEAYLKRTASRDE